MTSVGHLAKLGTASAAENSHNFLLKSVNIDISYKQVYRTFFGSLFISTFLSFLVLLLLLLFSFFQVSFFILFIMSILFVVFIASYFFAKKLTGEVDSADKELVGQLNKFLGDVKDNFPEEVYKKLFRKSVVPKWCSSESSTQAYISKMINRRIKKTYKIYGC